MINNSQNVNDLRIPPANHLEKLSGNLSGSYSIRINKQWGTIFKNTKKEFKGTDGAFGFIYAWNGNKKAGEG